MTSETRIIDGVAAVIHFSAMALTFHNDIDAPVYHPAFRGFIGGQGRMEPQPTATIFFNLTIFSSFNWQCCKKSYHRFRKSFGCTSFQHGNICAKVWNTKLPEIQSGSFIRKLHSDLNRLNRKGGTIKDREKLSRCNLWG